ncbi:MAG: hypothetical protein KC496_04325 [Anaerolineae bacterium]|nr:hypothetical protein [Anaerolineae bacterium]
MAVDYDALAREYGISRAAVEVLAEAIIRGNGTQAQFNHPDLGGMGQWQPGMTMIGDMFNQTLKAKVSQLCEVLARAYAAREIASAPEIAVMQMRWWSDEYGEATAAGQQNDLRYAFFAKKRRLLIQRGESITVYDTGDHQIIGVSQQQSNNRQDLSFQTERGMIHEGVLEKVSS